MNSILVNHKGQSMGAGGSNGDGFPEQAPDRDG
jgi:hypothetical protein